MNIIERLKAERQRVLQSDGKATTNGKLRQIDAKIAGWYAHVLPHKFERFTDTVTSEADTQQRVRVCASEQGWSLWRNNSGVLKDKYGTPIRFGLGNDSPNINKVFKSSDLVGVGPNGKMFVVECKKPDWWAPENDRDRAQLNFILHVVEGGGIGFFTNSLADFKRRMKIT